MTEPTLLLVDLAALFLSYRLGNRNLSGGQVACAASVWTVEPHPTFLFP